MPALPIASGILGGVRHRIPAGAGAVAGAGVVEGTAPGDREADDTPGRSGRLNPGIAMNGRGESNFP